LNGPIQLGTPYEAALESPRGAFNCYAERQAIRHAGKGGPYEGLAVIKNGHPSWTGEVKLVREHLEDPLKWSRPRRIFVNSMSDFFHEQVPFDYMEEMCSVMELAHAMHGHTFQILTKRPENMLAFFLDTKFGIGFAKMQHKFIHWGVSVENQEMANKRIPVLILVPVAMRWLSVEPMLGPVNLVPFFQCNCGVDPKNDQFAPPWAHASCCPYRARIHWVVIGGESGPGAREFDIEWARDLIRQCKAAEVPVFMKQVGSNAVEYFNSEFTPKDRKGGLMSEWPEDLRVREYPA
jgi:protein gp37